MRRHPIAAVVSDDGKNFGPEVASAFGEIPMMRFAGWYKNTGPSYHTGIFPYNMNRPGGTPPDGDTWITFSQNKEDIWVGRIPVPIRTRIDQHVTDDFSAIKDSDPLADWNLYSGQWTQVGLVDDGAGGKCLRLADKDRYDYASAMRVFPATSRGRVAIRLRAAQNHAGRLDLDLMTRKGDRPIRLSLRDHGKLVAERADKEVTLTTYQPGQWLDLVIEFDLPVDKVQVRVNGQPAGGILPPITSTATATTTTTSTTTTTTTAMPASNWVERLVLRTGPFRTVDQLDTSKPSGKEFGSGDKPMADEPENVEAVFEVQRVTTAAM